uniref:Uncharacterized protein n=1 Tax=Oryza punctata TaxID=4537 RepID=A0A0E0M530_ORYPU
MNGGQPRRRRAIRPTDFLCEGQGERDDKNVYWYSTGREDSSTNENGDESPVGDWSDDEYDGDEDNDDEEEDEDDEDEDEDEEEEEDDEYVDYSSSSSEEEGVDKIIINITDIKIEDEEMRGSSSFCTDSPLSDPTRKPKPEPMPQPDQPSN